MESETKKQIIDAAVMLFSKKGFETVSVQDICDLCKISKGGLYHHFSSKKDIFQALLDSVGGEYISVLEESCFYDGEFPKTLLNVFKAAIEFEKNHPDFFALYFSLSTNLAQTETSEIFKSFLTRIEKIFYGLFVQATKVFGNMKGFELMYSQIFQTNICYAIFKSKSEGKSITKKQMEKIIHAFLWGVAN